MFYRYESYPKALYHRDGRSVTVSDEAEHAALGDEWAESPAEFDEAEDEPRHDAVTVETAAADAAAPTKKRARKAAK